MRRKRIHAYAVFLAIGLVSGGARLAIAQKSEPEAVNDFGDSSAQLPSLSAQEVLNKIHLTNLTEIRAGELAAEKGESVLVRAMGDRLARDHRMADTLVMQAADQMGVPVQSVDLKDAAKISPMDSASGRAFDQAYVNMMIEGHLHAIATLSEAYDQQPKGSTLKSFLGKLLPILKQHLQVAENVKPWI